MTQAELLAISKPEELFSGDETEAKTLYRKLSHQWHPDKPTGKVEVFAHLSKLYTNREEKLREGTWEGAQDLQLAQFTLPVIKGFPTAFGFGYVTQGEVWYTYKPEHSTYWNTAKNAPRNFHYRNDEMRQEFERYLPVVVTSGFTDDGRRFVAYRKSEDLIRLVDAISHLKGFEFKHSAWIVSRLLNLCCYFWHSGIAHQNLSLETSFICPEKHTVVLLGGWEYLAKRGEAIKSVPRRTFEVMPFTAKTNKVASSMTDLELVKLVGRSLALYDRPPKPVNDWLNRVAVGNPVQQFTEWMETLKQAYGPRRFIHLKLSADDVYGRSTKKV